MKKILALTLSTLLLLSLFACNGGAAYKNNVNVDTLADKAIACIPLANGYSDWDEDTVDYYFGDAEKLADYEVYDSRDGNDHNLFGIFKAKNSDDVSKIKSACESFIRKYSNDISGSVQNYAPGEAAKFDNAKVSVYGDYVLVTILSASDTSAVCTAVENALKADK